RHRTPIRIQHGRRYLPGQRQSAVLLAARRPLVQLPVASCWLVDVRAGRQPAVGLLEDSRLQPQGQRARVGPRYAAGEGSADREPDPANINDLAPPSPVDREVLRLT